MNKKIACLINNLNNYGKLKKYTVKVSHKNNVCGDRVEIYLKIRKNKISDIKYTLNSCILCHASTEVLINIIKKKKINYCQKIVKKLLHSKFEKLNLKKKFKHLNFLFNKKNSLRKDCIYVPFYAINKINKKI